MSQYIRNVINTIKVVGLLQKTLGNVSQGMDFENWGPLVGDWTDVSDIKMEKILKYVCLSMSCVSKHTPRNIIKR